MKNRYATALLALVACSAAASAGASATAPAAPADWRPPTWRLGETFDVELTVPTLVMPMEPIGSLDGEPWTQVVHYRVVGTGVASDQPVVFVRASPERLDSEYMHVIDVQRMALVEMQIVLPGGEALHSANPFAGDAVLWSPMQFGPLIADFPRLSADAPSGDRRVDLPHDTFPAFTERLVPQADGSLVVELERADPDSGAVHRVTQRWLPGQPWWSSATATLGDRTLATGRLVRTAVSGGLEPLYLPIADPGPFDAGPMN